MIKKKGLKLVLRIAALALICAGVVMTNVKITSKACMRKYLGPFNSKVMVTTPLCQYTGSEIEPEFKVYYKNIELQQGTDYVVTYKNNIEPGTATLTVKGVGAYMGKKKAKFTIEKQENTDIEDEDNVEIEDDDQNQDQQEDIDNQELTKIDFQDNEIFAVAAVSRFSVESLANEYLTNPSELTYVDAGMGEAYMIFPKNKGVKITVETVGFDEEFNLVPSGTLAQDVTGAVVIYSNPVEYIPHFQVVAEYNGEKVVFPISYSGVDGRLVNNSECVKDITP